MNIIICAYQFLPQHYRKNVFEGGKGLLKWKRPEISTLYNKENPRNLSGSCRLDHVFSNLGNMGPDSSFCGQQANHRAERPCDAVATVLELLSYNIIKSKITHIFKLLKFFSRYPLLDWFYWFSCFWLKLAFLIRAR